MYWQTLTVTKTSFECSGLALLLFERVYEWPKADKKAKWRWRAFYSQYLSEVEAGCSPCCALWVHRCLPRRGAEVFFLRRQEQSSQFSEWMNESKNEYFWVMLGHANLPCLSFAFTSAPISSRVSRQGCLSDSSLARSKGLLSWIYQVAFILFTYKQRRYQERT